MNTEKKILCPLPGLEAVTVTYDLMAPWGQVQELRKLLTPETAQPVIVKIENWPIETYGDNPFGPGSPMAFQLWAANGGYNEAARAWVQDPNSLTAWTPSSPPTSAEK
jgi:hypothetical protein